MDRTHERDDLPKKRKRKTRLQQYYVLGPKQPETLECNFGKALFN